MRPVLVVVAALVMVSACRRPAEKAKADSVAVNAAIDPASLERARRAADALGGDLVQMLTSELKRGGPEAAIAVCADSAQVHTRRHGLEGGTIRRVGTRVRNTANAPDAMERSVLDAFGAAIAENRSLPDTAFIVADAGGRPELHYMRAIRIQEMCLACHGAPDRLTPAVRSVLQARYPDDQATGYSVGQLRGAISVRVALP